MDNRERAMLNMAFWGVIFSGTTQAWRMPANFWDKFFAVIAGLFLCFYGLQYIYLFAMKLIGAKS